jgi:hypothetical protein
MAIFACGRKIGSRVIWICGSSIIGLVTRATFIGNPGIIPGGMTFITVVDRMPINKGEKFMINGGTVPGHGIHAMTVDTIFWIIIQHMVWCCGRCITGLVTVVTLNAHRIKTQQWSCCGRKWRRRGKIGMTAGTISRNMCTKKRKSALPVHLCYIGHHPGVWGMAPCTVVANRLLMHVGMASIAFCLRLSKFEWGMALFAIDFLMLTHEWEFRNLMVEGKFFEINFPSISLVTILAA